MTQPIILTADQLTQENLDNLRDTQKIWAVKDIYEDQLKELFEIEHPGLNDESALNAYLTEKPHGDLAGAWVYYPWSGVLLHCVDEDDFFRLRTNRNQNLITAEEQRQLYDSVVGVFGMSVGNSIALTAAYSGMSRSMKLADFDKLETANLNRLRANLTQLGEAKIAIAAQQLYELNPFAQLYLFEEGVDDSNIDQFFSDPQPAVVFDEIDDFPMKIKLRLKARSLGVPVVMLTSLGDNILVDVERYDLESELPLFNGLIGHTPEDILQATIGEREKVQYAIDLVGAEHIPAKALESLFEINRTLVGRPQLASTIAVDGGLGSFLVRKLVLGDLPSGRYYLSFESALGLVNSEDPARKEAVIIKLNQMLGRG